MATEANITKSNDWFKGTDMKLEWTMNPVVDISTWSINFGMATEKGGTILLAQTVVIDDGPNGVFSVTIADDATDNLDARDYFYEVKRMDAGSERILAYGIATIREIVGVV